MIIVELTILEEKFYHYTFSEAFCLEKTIPNCLSSILLLNLNLIVNEPVNVSVVI